MTDFEGAIHNEGFTEWFLSQNRDAAPGAVVARIGEYAEDYSIDGFELSCVIAAGVDPLENPSLSCALIKCCSDTLTFRSNDLPPRNYPEILERVLPSLFGIAEYANSVKEAGGYYDKCVRFFESLRQELAENGIDASSVPSLTLSRAEI